MAATRVNHVQRFARGSTIPVRSFDNDYTNEYFEVKRGLGGYKVGMVPNQTGFSANGTERTADSKMGTALQGGKPASTEQPLPGIQRERRGAAEEHKAIGGRWDIRSPRRRSRTGARVSRSREGRWPSFGGALYNRDVIGVRHNASGW